jgi:hypothetical protein
MLFVLQNPIVRSQSLEKVEPKFQRAYFFTKTLFLRTPLTAICNYFMLFVLQNPIVRSQSLEKVELKFQGAYVFAKKHL